MVGVSAEVIQMHLKLLPLLAVAMMWTAEAHHQPYRAPGSLGAPQDDLDDTSSEEKTFSWTRDFGDGILAQESAVVNDDVIAVDSSDLTLDGQGYSRAKIYYDFSKPRALVVIVPVNVPACFLTTTQLTYPLVLESLGVINGSVAVSDQRVRLDGTFRPLTRYQVGRVYRAHPFLHDVCPGREVVNVFPEGTEVKTGYELYSSENPEPFYTPSRPQSATEEVTFSTLESAVTIIVPAPSYDPWNHRRFGPG